MTTPHPLASALQCTTGQPRPLGASLDRQQGLAGVNFAVFAPLATQIVVCLFEGEDAQPTAQLTLPSHTQGVWHGFVPGLGAGQLYGLRAQGPYQPERGHRFNPAKLLIDPFARDLVGPLSQLSLERDYLGACEPGGELRQTQPDPQDNAARIPKARVLDWAAELQAGANVTPRPIGPPARAVLYEAHVKGLTQLHPEVAPALRGRFAGLVSAAMLAHYRRLGITTLCLLPVQLHITEAHLLRKGLSNYWGYNTLGYFVPMPAYASGQFANVREEFRYMVDQLHRHGLQLVLDVVYNHSAESDALGPTLSWRGLDNRSWYALNAQGQHLNFSGCGNSFDMVKTGVKQLVLDSLRWWVQVFGVDGFRFDLATSLGRDSQQNFEFSPVAGVLAAIAEDPLLRQTTLIVEPWDVGPNGYQLGRFAAPWQEWNDRFRDACRSYWLGHGAPPGELARRLTASSDLFQSPGRTPLASLNLITAHDGMPLADLCAYSDKHNQANGEDNRDGHDHNLSANAGVEGPSDDAQVRQRRGQWARAMLATLLCAQGSPQLLAGDEIGHSQRGNNNAYCQDNATTWLDWGRADDALTSFVAQLIHLRQAHPALRGDTWLTGRAERGRMDVCWRCADGEAMTAAHWEDSSWPSLACQLDVGEAGAPALQQWFLIFHAVDAAQTFALPPGTWLQVLDSAAALVVAQASWAQARTFVDEVPVSPQTVVAMVQLIQEAAPAL